METIKNLVNVTAIIVGILFFSGLFGWNISSGGTIFLGLAEIVTIVWLAVLVNKKSYGIK